MFEKVIDFLMDKPAPKASVKKAHKKQIVKQNDEVKVAPATPEDFIMGKNLFWGRYPHYPEMSTIYRKIFQKYNIDNTKVIKVHDAICGADMCNISAGSGPNVEYLCGKDLTSVVDKHIKLLALSKKFEHLSSDHNAKKQEYAAHVYSFYPKLDAESHINWLKLAENTAPGGFVFLPKIITNSKEALKKPSEKLADNIEFYFYINLDHTAHWINVIENKIAALETRTAENLKRASKHSLIAFKDEVTKWAIELKRLKTGQIKMMTAVYKRDDV